LITYFILLDLINRKRICRQPTRGGPLWELDEGLTTPGDKNITSYRNMYLKFVTHELTYVLKMII